MEKTRLNTLLPLLATGGNLPPGGGIISMALYMVRIFAVVALVRCDQNSINWCWALLAEKPIFSS